jgi:hypothetical protein
MNFLQTYLRRLTNLSSSNRSLLLLRLSKWHDIDFQDFDFLLNKSAFDVLRPLLEGKTKVDICEMSNPRMAANNIAAKRLRNISRKNQLIMGESGAQDLHVAYPFVEGRLSNGQLIRCPLLFFPVSLVPDEAQNTWQLLRRPDEPVVFNKSFLLAYSLSNQQTAPENLMEFVGDSLPSDALEFRTQLYELLKNSALNINFNSEILADRLQHFIDFTKTAYEETHRQSVGVLRLSPNAVLGLFPQADSFLAPDYQELIAQNANVEDFLGIEPTEIAAHQIKEEQTFAPYAIDASQERALHALKAGQSVVVQGPPGTGKSQLICNVISDYIARGKKVLVLSQKRAALDVVFQRLAQGDMQEFVALVHDFQADRRAVYAQLSEQIEKIDDYKKKNNTLNAIDLERNFVQTSRLIDQHVQQLDEYKTAFFSEQEMGLSVKTLYLTSSAQMACPDLGAHYKAFDANLWTSFQQKFSAYSRYVDILHNVDNLWKNRRNYAHFSHTDLQRLLQSLSEIKESREEIKTYFLDLSIVNQWIEAENELKKLQQLLENPRVFDLWKILVENQFSLSTLWKTLQRVCEKLPKNGFVSFPDERKNSWNRDLWTSFLEKARKAEVSHKGLVTRLWWQWTSVDKQEIADFLQHNQLDINNLVERVEAVITFWDTINKQKPKAFFTMMPQIIHAEQVNEWLEMAENAVKAAELWISMSFVHNNAHLSTEGVDKWQISVQKLWGKAAFIHRSYQQWCVYLHEEQVQDVLDGQDIHKYTAYYTQFFDELVAFDKFCTGFSTNEQELLHILDAYIHKNPQTYAHFVENWSLLDNAWRMAWITHLENKYPVLQKVSSVQFELWITELQEAVARKEQLTADILLLRNRERTYRQLTFNRLGNQVTYKELLHQTTKKRKIWPLRRLMETFAEEIFALCPCWLASPETVSAIFPLQKQFDLVIFDEASQCFAEKGLPAMYRGKQVLVAGDDKQLPPHQLYQVRWESPTDEDSILTEVDSLLKLAATYLPQYPLLGHYRSRMPELIHFSNQAFYKGKLQILPNRNDLNAQTPAIRYVKINGLWENNSNLPEAEKVVELMWQLLENESKSVGVVTFNNSQQQLIAELWEKKLQENRRNEPPDWFVKNIENVQGDERDIIIFSVGYAPDVHGKVAAQFGSLNAQGGENRLNVAVTRAREQVQVVCSFWPSQLSVENTLHDGPKLFKAYMQYALDVSEKRWQFRMNEKQETPSYQNLAQKLQQANEHWKKILPFADLTVQENGVYQSLALTDDNLYFQSLSAKDWFVYQPRSFKKQQWPFAWQHSRQWWKCQK